MPRAICWGSTSGCERSVAAAKASNEPMNSVDAALSAEYFDGRRAQAHAVQLRTLGGELLIKGDGIALSVPLQRVRWPERQRHGGRRIVLDDGSIVRCADASAFDAFANAAGAGDSITVRAQQSWRW